MTWRNSYLLISLNMKNSFIKGLFIQYIVIFFGISLMCLPYIFFFWLLPHRWDLGYLSWLEYTIVIIFFLSIFVFVIQDVIFRAIWKIKIKNMELFLLVVFTTGIFLMSDFSFMGDFLQILSNFLLSPIIFGLYLVYIKYKS